jgi:hypothetical protein
VRISVLYRNDHERPLTDPVPEIGGRWFVLRIYSGDYCDPIGGTWFDPQKLPRFVLRARMFFMPFIAWRWPFSKAGYAGFKLFGVDSPAYKNWLPLEEVYEGSQACCFSLRPFAGLVKR